VDLDLFNLKLVGHLTLCEGSQEKLMSLRTEIVLSVLLTSFEFFSGQHKITWTMPGVSAPVVEGDDITHPSLPMLVSALDI